MRQVYALLGLVRRFGAPRVEAVCAEAVAVELFDVYRLKRMLALASPPAPLPAADRPVPPARFLRPAAQYALRLGAPAADGGAA